MRADKCSASADYSGGCATPKAEFCGTLPDFLPNSLLKNPKSKDLTRRHKVDPIQYRNRSHTQPKCVQGLLLSYLHPPCRLLIIRVFARCTGMCECRDRRRVCAAFVSDFFYPIWVFFNKRLINLTDNIMAQKNTKQE
jgi:hypothetical protein